jgi:hypothetical protein
MEARRENEGNREEVRCTTDRRISLCATALHSPLVTAAAAHSSSATASSAAISPVVRVRPERRACACGVMRCVCVCLLCRCVLGVCMYSISNVHFVCTSPSQGACVSSPQFAPAILAMSPSVLSLLLALLFLLALCVAPSQVAGQGDERWGQAVGYPVPRDSGNVTDAPHEQPLAARPHFHTMSSIVQVIPGCASTLTGATEVGVRSSSLGMRATATGVITAIYISYNLNIGTLPVTLTLRVHASLNVAPAASVQAAPAGFVVQAAISQALLRTSISSAWNGFPGNRQLNQGYWMYTRIDVSAFKVYIRSGQYLSLLAVSQSFSYC